MEFTFFSLVPVSLNNFKCIFQNVSLNAAMAQTFLPGVTLKFPIRRRDNHALSVTLGRYNIHITQIVVKIKQKSSSCLFAFFFEINASKRCF